MKKYLVAAVVTLLCATATLAAAQPINVRPLAPVSSDPVPADVGSCYSVPPICYGNDRPTCMCDLALNCYWACR